MKISRRLEAIAQQCSGFNYLADVGCDHGLLSIYVVKKYNFKHVYLIDINKLPLKSAEENCKKNKIINCSFILSNGLKDFNEEVDCLVISGMGGHLIKDIINDSFEKIKKIKKIILQPNTDHEVLREYLYENKFEITFEDMIIDNKKYCYYLCAQYSGDNIIYNVDDIEFGKLRNKVYLDFLERRYKKLKDEINNINDDIIKLKIIEEVERSNKIIKELKV